MLDYIKCNEYKGVCFALVGLAGSVSPVERVFLKDILSYARYYWIVDNSMSYC